MTKQELKLLASAASIGATREYYIGKELKALHRAIAKARTQSKPTK